MNRHFAGPHVSRHQSIPGFASSVGDEYRARRRRKTFAYVGIAAVGHLALIGLPLSNWQFASAAGSDGQPPQTLNALHCEPARTSDSSIVESCDRGAVDALANIAAAPQESKDPLESRVRSVIERGRKFLVAAQHKDGTFSDSVTNKKGMTALALLALLKSGSNPDDPAIISGIRALESGPLLEGTCETSLLLATLVAAGRQDRGNSRLATLAQSLEASQKITGAHAGMWNDGRGTKGGEEEDNCNTGFAVLGLEAAASANVPIKSETWQLTADHFVKFQNRDGGWGSRNGARSTGSMTCTAIASLLTCERRLASKEKAVGRPRSAPSAVDRLKSSDRAARRGLEWLAQFFAPGINPGQDSKWTFYYRFEMSRVGRLSGQKLFGKHDWYGQCAPFLIAEQWQWNGSWHASQGPESDSCLATSFALLFLCEGLDSQAPGGTIGLPPQEPAEDRNKLPARDEPSLRPDKNAPLAYGQNRTLVAQGSGSKKR